MISPENEKVKFVKQIPAKGDVEDWLFKVQEIMVETLYKAMKTGRMDFENKERR